MHYGAGIQAWCSFQSENQLPHLKNAPQILWVKVHVIGEKTWQFNISYIHLHLYRKGFSKKKIASLFFDSLTDLEEFIKVTDAGLKRQLLKGDYNGLVEILGHLLAVRDRQIATDELFEPLKETIALLESYGHKMPEQVYVLLEVL